MSPTSARVWRAGALGWILAAACAAPSVPLYTTVAVTDGVARGAVAVGDAPRVLGVVAHPDDEFSFAGALFKTATHLGGACALVTITDGQGGFKYATFAEALHGLPLTEESTGRRELPAVRRAEQLESSRLLGLTRLYYLNQPDHRYTTDLGEVLGAHAEVWDLEAVARALDEVLAQGRFDFVLVHPPTVTTHAHHQAATLLALEAVLRMPRAQQPVVLCAEVESGPDNGPPWLAPAAVERCAAAQLAAGPFTFDRTQSFGYRNQLDYRLVIDAAIGRHVSQGTMLRLMGQGTREEYWVLGEVDAAQEARVRAWFERLAEPQYPGRDYGPSAGVMPR